MKDKQLSLTESGFLFDHNSGLTYSLNPTATRIMQMLMDEEDAETIVQKILEEYEVDEKEARFDIEQFVQQLKKFDLL
ncbi:MAG: HPr-rel-A system PqqD family peptide chaperone [bacterium]|nr:HPr-rel-A system PqqD family peptide chaperone [bacterium]